MTAVVVFAITCEDKNMVAEKYNASAIRSHNERMRDIPDYIIFRFCFKKPACVKKRVLFLGEYLSANEKLHSGVFNALEIFIFFAFDFFYIL